MTDVGKEKQEEGRENATDSRTLDEIEADEQVGSSETESSVPSPDEGSGRTDSESESHGGDDYS